MSKFSVTNIKLRDSWGSSKFSNFHANNFFDFSEIPRTFLNLGIPFCITWLLLSNYKKAVHKANFLLTKRAVISPSSLPFPQVAFSVVSIFKQKMQALGRTKWDTEICHLFYPWLDSLKHLRHFGTWVLAGNLKVLEALGHSKDLWGIGYRR